MANENPVLLQVAECACQDGNIIVTDFDLRGAALDKLCACLRGNVFPVCAAREGQDLQPPPHRLELVHNQLGNSGMAKLSEPLAENTCLSELYIGYNYIEERACNMLCDALLRNHSLQTLHIVSNSFGSEGALYVSRLISGNPFISTIVLCKNDITCEGAVHIARAMGTSRTLKHLSLLFNDIGARGCVALAEALRSNSSLLSLRLSGNQVGVAGLTAIAASLRENTSLRSLELSDGDEAGLVAICDSLVQSRRIDSLTLVEFDITTDKSALALCNILSTPLYLSTTSTATSSSSSSSPVSSSSPSVSTHQEQTALTSLDLTHCFISIPCTVEILRTVRFNETLRHFRLAEHVMEGQEVLSDEIFQLIYYNTSLTSLHLDYFSFSTECRDSLLASLTNNTTLVELVSECKLQCLGPGVGCALLDRNKSLQLPYLLK